MSKINIINIVSYLSIWCIIEHGVSWEDERETDQRVLQATGGENALFLMLNKSIRQWLNIVGILWFASEWFARITFRWNHSPVNL